MKNSSAFSKEVAAHLVRQGFVASHPTGPFHSGKGEFFDRPSSVSPNLIECIDIEFDEEGIPGYVVTAYFSLTSAYEKPAYLLRETLRYLSPDGVSHFCGSEPFHFPSDAASAMCTAIDRFLLPSLREQADLAYLRDFHLFIGGFKRKECDFSVFQQLGFGPSRHLRSPDIIALLEAYLGNFKYAIKYLKLYGIPDTSQSTHVDIDLGVIEPEEIRKLGISGLIEKYGKPVSHWQIDFLRDLESGTVKTRTAADVLQCYRRAGYVAGYEKR